MTGWEPLGGSHVGWLEVPLGTCVYGHLVWLVLIGSTSGHLPGMVGLPSRRCSGEGLSIPCLLSPLGLRVESRMAGASGIFFRSG